MGKVNYEEPLAFRIADRVRTEGYEIEDIVSQDTGQINIYKRKRRFLSRERRSLASIYSFGKPSRSWRLSINHRKDYPRMKELADKLAEDFDAEIDISVSAE